MFTCNKCKYTSDIRSTFAYIYEKTGKGTCKECRKLYKKQYVTENKEKIQQYIDSTKEIRSLRMKNYYRIDKNRKKIIERSTKRNTLHPEKHRIYYKKYKFSNIEKVREGARRSIKKHIEKANHHTAMRRARKKKATPPWLTEIQINEIKNFYKLAKRLQREDGIKRHVDHIVPLKGENVCGLHVPWNLQILTAEENIRKHNRIIINTTSTIKTIG